MSQTLSTAEPMRLSYRAPVQVCSCCGVEKPISEFYRESYTGLPTKQCKECTLIKRRAQRQAPKTGKFVSKEKLRGMEAVEYNNDDWKAALLHFRGVCCYCGRHEGRAKDTRFDREHFVPLSRGGKTVRSNIGPACRKCNRGRGNTPLFRWFRAQPFWTESQEQLIAQWIGEEAATKEGYHARKP